MYVKYIYQLIPNARKFGFGVCFLEIKDSLESMKMRFLYRVQYNNAKITQQCVTLMIMNAIHLLLFIVCVRKQCICI